METECSGDSWQLSVLEGIHCLVILSPNSAQGESEEGKMEAGNSDLHHTAVPKAYEVDPCKCIMKWSETTELSLEEMKQKTKMKGSKLML